MRNRSYRTDKDKKKLDRLERQKQRLETNLGGREKPKVTELKARTEGQRHYLQAIRENRIVFCIGPAGTGKSFIAAGMAAKALKAEQVERIVCVRPAVEAANTPGKNTLGYLPGDQDAKLNPYLKPLLRQLSLFFGEAEMRRLRGGEAPIIELYPLENLRGENLDNAFVIFDEAQNASFSQMKMFLTRLAEGSQFVINGDASQTDLPEDMAGALDHYADLLEGIEGIGVVEMDKRDIVRDPLLAKMMERI